VVLFAVELPIDGNVYVPSVSTPDFGVIAAINNGLAGSTSTSLPSLFCATGNCTWPTFASLAVCSSCNDVSSRLRKSSGTTDFYNGDVFTGPGNAGLPIKEGLGTRYDFGEGNTSFHINNFNGELPSSGSGLGEFMTAKGYSMPNDTVNFQNLQSLLYAITMIKPEDGYRSGKIAWEDARVSATECALYLCVNAYNTSMQDGVLNETVVDSWVEKAPLSWLPQEMQPSGVSISNWNSKFLGTPAWSPIGLDEQGRYVNRTDFQLTIPPADARRLNISEVSFNATQRYLGSTSTYMSSLLPSLNGSATNDTIMGKVLSRTDGIQFTDTIMQPLFESKNLTETFEQIAHSITTQFRASPGSVQNGTLETWTTFFHIRWGFLVLPLALIVGGSVFMLASMIESRRWNIEPWKASALTTLAYGLDERTRVQLRRACGGADMEEAAAMIRVQLLDGRDGLELR
jgi:hypothetical protein